MVDLATSGDYFLSADDLKSLAPDWPDALLEDYLARFRNIQALLLEIEAILLQASNNEQSIEALNVLMPQNIFGVLGKPPKIGNHQPNDVSAKNLYIGDSSVTSTQVSWTIGENLTTAYELIEGNNEYLGVRTSIGAEEMAFGNTATNPDFIFRGSGSYLFGGGDASFGGGLDVSGTVTGDIIDQTNVLIQSSTTLSDGSGAAAGTLANAPTSGDPTKWVEIDDNGTTRYIPTWT